MERNFKKEIQEAAFTPIDMADMMAQLVHVRRPNSNPAFPGNVYVSTKLIVFSTVNYTLDVCEVSLESNPVILNVRAGEGAMRNLATFRATAGSCFVFVFVCPTTTSSSTLGNKAPQEHLFFCNISLSLSCTNCGITVLRAPEVHPVSARVAQARLFEPATGDLSRG